MPYDSGGLALDAFLVRPRSHALDRSGRSPLLVYYHGGFALDETDVAAVAPFLEAGFAVLLPTLRAENGNPGDFEMFFGELDDARAALERARSLRGIDPDRIAIFGHSAGAVLTALLSMSADLGVVAAGGAGGLYDTDAFDEIAISIPFRDSPEERRLRVPVPHIEQLRTPHWACIGEGDWIIDVARAAHARADAAGAPLELVTMPGDHGGSLLPCMRSFLVHARVRAEAVPVRALPPEAPGPSRVAGARPLSTSGSFDLVLRDSGALLVWSANEASGIRAEPLAADGSSSGPSVLLVPGGGHVREIEATVAGDQLALVWSTTDGHTTTQRAHAAVGPLGGPLGAPTELGEVDPDAIQATRGNLAVVPHGEGFLTAVRTAGRCAEGAGCAAVVFAPLGARGSRRTVALEHACTRAIVGSASGQDGPIVALCDGTSLVRVALGDGAPAITREQASCPDLALLEAGGERRVARCPAPSLLMGTSTGTSELTPSCEEGVLRLGSEITLGGAAVGLAPLLPDTLAPDASRVVWTGTSLIVGVRSGTELLLRRHVCEAGRLASAP